MNKEELNWRFNRVVLYVSLMGQQPAKIHYMIRSNSDPAKYIFTENPYEGSYAGPYERSNVLSLELAPF